MSVVAVMVFVAACALIASDRVNKTLVALAGAAIVSLLPVIRSDDVFLLP
jgi:Na+/H+ antiporter NhaD/arsenite permease-like protein